MILLSFCWRDVYFLLLLLLNDGIRCSESGRIILAAAAERFAVRSNSLNFFIITVRLGYSLFDASCLLSQNFFASWLRSSSAVEE